ncbi:MAG: prephenate dehydrogenase/arogenate dehydrogenase family protein, partial [Nitrospirae bacterium]|nr:prephenate dehydrogenase/arogenate dehydrogenase family protein [Nitrospirota bacterium]
MGASFALAIKKQCENGGPIKCDHISGYGRDVSNLENAMGRGIIDSYSVTPSELAADCDMVVIAAPVGAFAALAANIAPHLSEGAIVTDVGSVKGRLVYDMEKALPKGVHFVGVHPIAGKDRSGIDAADANLFEKAHCIITPTSGTDVEALDKISRLWRLLGSNVIVLTPEKHDEILSAISHLPHVAAFALVNAVEYIDDEFLNFSGTGFRDTTRIAMSSPDIWSDICLMNKENILKHIDV